MTEHKMIEQKFKKNYGFLKSSEIESRTDWRMLRKMLDDNTVTKVKRGVYRLNSAIRNDQHVELAKMIPDGVFCMFSAWYYYNLALYIPFEHHIAIRKSKKVTLPSYPPVKLYYRIDEYYLLGITEVEIDNHKVKIYDLEKSVCDAIRFRKVAGIDTTAEILKNYLNRQDRDLNKLIRYARILRIEKFVMDTISMML
jgi:predicted transcriptional regulator of viral defense system